MEQFVRCLPRKVIVIANQKGGVGKTTVSINLSVALAIEGKKVMLIDLDPQGNATSGLGASKSVAKTVYDVLIRQQPIADAILSTAYPNLSILPADMNLAGASIEMAGMDFREFILKKVVDSVRDSYDFILIDTPPSLGLLTVNAFVAADQILIPMQCEFFALEGVSQLLQVYESIKNFGNPNLEILGVVLSMVDVRMRLTEAVATEIRNHFNGKVMSTIIPRNIRMAEAPSFGQPIQAYAPDSKGALAIESLAREILYGPDKSELVSSAFDGNNVDIKTVSNRGNYEESSIRAGTIRIDSNGTTTKSASFPYGGDVTDRISVSNISEIGGTERISGRFVEKISDDSADRQFGSEPLPAPNQV